MRSIFDSHRINLRSQISQISDAAQISDGEPFHKILLRPAILYWVWYTWIQFSKLYNYVIFGIQG